MISNYEFIKTQAFEISWAVFRCAELFSQDTLRREVEAAAIDLIASYAMLHETTGEEFPRIEKLTSLILLAESVGQIASVNANVLYRELDNLTKAIRVDVIDRREKKNITTSLEHMFTNSEYVNNLQLTTGNQQQKNTNIESSASVSPVIPVKTGIQSSKNSADQFGSIESLLSAAVQSSQPMSGAVSSANVNSANTAVHETLNAFLQHPVPAVIPAAHDQTPIIVPVVPAKVTAHVAPSPVQVGSWQHVILQKVKELGQTTTKELSASFPEISERTIRFYLQKLVDNQAIDRIGSTGPGAAYKAK